MTQGFYIKEIICSQGRVKIYGKLQSQPGQRPTEEFTLLMAEIWMLCVFWYKCMVKGTGQISVFYGIVCEVRCEHHVLFSL